MRFTHVTRALALGAAAAVVGCSGGGGPARSSSIPPTAAVGSPTPGAQVASNATLRITVPTSSAASSSTTRSAKYVSPATQSLVAIFTPANPTPSATPCVGACTLATAAPNATSFTVNLTQATNPQCSATTPVVCTVSFALATGAYTLQIATYDVLQATATYTPGPTPTPRPNVLTANTGIPVTIAAGQANPIDVTLGGTPASFGIAFVPTTTVSGGQGSFAYDRCGTAPQAMSVVAIDADGNFIVGPGAPALTVTDANGLVNLTQNAPNGFSVSLANGPPTFGAQETILVASGNLSTTARISFSDEYCGITTTTPYSGATLTGLTGPAPAGGTPLVGLSTTAAQVYTLDPTTFAPTATFGSGVAGVALDGQGTAGAFYKPQGITTDGRVNQPQNPTTLLYVADGQFIRTIDASGNIATVDGTFSVSPSSVDGSGIGGPPPYATFTNVYAIANFYYSGGTGGWYVLDGPSSGPFALRRVRFSNAGYNSVTTIEANVAGNPTGVAADSQGNAYIADAASNTIKKVTGSGVVTTLAGSGSAGTVDGTTTAAQFDNPVGIAFDGTNLIVTQQSLLHPGVGAIREVTLAGVVTTIAGGTIAGSQTDGTGAAAGFTGLGAVDAPRGLLYLVDSQKLRKVQ